MSSDASRSGERDWRTDPEAFADLVIDHAGKAVREAVAEHHRAGHPVPIWRDGRVVHLYPDGSTRPVEEPPQHP